MFLFLLLFPFLMLVHVFQRITIVVIYFLICPSFFLNHPCSRICSFMVDSHNDKFHNVSLPSRSSVQAHSNALPAPVSKREITLSFIVLLPSVISHPYSVLFFFCRSCRHDLSAFFLSFSHDCRRQLSNSCWIY